MWLSADDTGNAFLTALGGIAGGLYFFATGFRLLRRKRLIENTPTSKIRSLAMGQVEISGEALPCAEGQVLTAPFTGRACLYYRYTIEEHRRSGKRSRWVTLRDETECVPLLARDETGVVLVDPTGAEVSIPADFREESGFGSDPPEAVRNFLRSQGVAFEGWFGANKRMRFAEYHIAPGDKLYILGAARDNPRVAEGSGTTNAEDIMIGAGTDGQEYFISDCSEKECVRKHALRVVLRIYGGIVLAVAGVGYLLVLLDKQFGWALF